ncbi:hypothetical protein IWW51_000171, partial [Coemansia sp. RSA 2702]
PGGVPVVSAAARTRARRGIGAAPHALDPEHAGIGGRRLVGFRRVCDLPGRDPCRLRGAPAAVSARVPCRVYRSLALVSIVCVSIMQTRHYFRSTNQI